MKNNIVTYSYGIILLYFDDFLEMTFYVKCSITFLWLYMTYWDIFMNILYRDFLMSFNDRILDFDICYAIFIAKDTGIC